MGGGRVEGRKEEGGRSVCVCVERSVVGVGGVTFLPERTLEQYHPPATIIEKKTAT